MKNYDGDRKDLPAPAVFYRPITDVIDESCPSFSFVDIAFPLGLCLESSANDLNTGNFFWGCRPSAEKADKPV
jgi:hypothetical protein